MEMAAVAASASSPSAPTLRRVNFHSITLILHRHSTFFNNPTKVPTLFASFPPRRSTKRDINSETGHNPTADELPNPAPNPEDPPPQNGDVSPPTLSLSSPRGLVLDLGPPGSWDSGEIGSPVVKRFLSDEEERWVMWYHGNSNSDLGSDSLGLAVSSNGIHWERPVAPVMNPGQDWWSFDTVGIRPGEVVVMSSSKLKASSGAVYWLYYTGSTAEKVETLVKTPQGFSISRSLPGLAISQDGRHWARIEGDHHSGALFDVGDAGEWDSLFVAGPQVVFHGSGDLRMYYHSFDGESQGFCIGMARSRDGIKWVKLGKVLGGGYAGGFDELGVMNPSVARSNKDGRYVMAYQGIARDGKRSLGMAVSEDGLRGWRRVKEGGGGVLRGEEELGGGWDGEGVGDPCLVQMDGEVDEWRVYYCGVGKEGRSGIGMAVSNGDDISCFTKWKGFQL